MRLVLVCMLVLLAGGAHAEDLPDWIANPHGDYPEDRYLVGVGSGDSPAAAAEDARAALAESFRSDVRSVTSSRDEVLETWEGEGDEFRRRSMLTSAVEVVATADLPNVTVVETWQDGRGRTWAMVSLSRDDAAAVFLADLADHREEITRLLAEKGNHPDVVASYRGACRARSLARDSARLAAQYRVITRGDRAPSSRDLRTPIMQWFEEARSGLTLSIGEAPPPLRATLRQTLIAAGFTIVPEQGHFVADLAYRTEESPGTDRFAFERWTMDLRIRRARGGPEFASFHHSDRAGHRTQESARRRCLLQVKDVLRDGIQAELTTLLERDPESDPAHR